MPPPPGAAVRRRAGVGLGLVAAVGLFAGGAELARRSSGWFRPAPAAPFRVVVPAGDAVVRRGDAITLSAYLEPTAPDAALPAAVELVTRPGPGEPEARVRMTPDRATGAAVAVLPPAAADFEYRVEAGPAASEWFAVRVADPVELAPGTAVEIAPPSYAAGAVKPRTVPGFPDLDAVTGSTATFRFRFTRPAASAALEWRPDAPNGLPETLPVGLDPDAAGGTARVTLREPGRLRLVLANEAGVRRLRTEVAARVTPKPDEPPRVEALSGLFAAPRTVAPGQKATIAVTLADDLGVASAELEVAAGPGFATVTRLPVALTGAGTPVAAGTVTFDPTAAAGKDAKLRVRLRATDSRPGAAPTTYPPDGWAEWAVSPAAPPPDAQEAFGPRDAVAARLAAAQADLAAAAKTAAALRDATGKGGLPVDHAARLADARAKAKAAAEALRRAATDAGLTVSLRPLAGSLRSLADGMVGEADDALRRAATDDPTDRRAALELAAARLGQAGERAAQQARAAADLARTRLDADRLARLAAEFATLADRAAAGAPAAEVVAERTRLAVRFRGILADSEPLRAASAAAAGAERRDLADRAAALSAAAHDLDATAERLAADVRAAAGAELAAEQEALAERAAATLGSLATPARLARLTLPDPADAHALARQLAAGGGADGLTALEKFAQALDRAAEAFEQSRLDPADGKAVARALARWQDDLRGRAGGFAVLPDAAKAALRSEQRTLLAAAGGLNLPPDPMLVKLREPVVVHLDQAARRLDADGADAETAMRLAAEALSRLADAAPAAADRLVRTRPELDKLRTDHASAAAAAEELLRPLEKKLPDETVRRGLAGASAAVAGRYDGLAARLTALDLPGFEARQRTTVAALRAVAADLRAGLPLDSFASVAAARRALDRLHAAANNQPPADAQADELARLQAVVAGRPAVHLTTQPEVTKRLDGLVAPEAPVLLHDARAAAKRAEGDVPRYAAVAADVLAALADRLAGRRPDADRVLAFAAARTCAAAAARAKAGTPRNPEASREEARQLDREAGELGFVRVGPAGQLPKWRALDLYARLKARAEPERDASAQAELAEALASLAAVSVGVADVVRNDSAPVPDPGAGYLPAPPLAAPLRELARAERRLRDRAGMANAEVAARLKPADGAPFAEAERKQRELATSAGNAVAARLAADRLRVGDARTAAEAAEMAVVALRSGEPTLSERQAGLLAEIRALAGSTRAAATRQAARARELAREADELAAAVAAADQPAAVRGVAEEVRRAARSLTAAADKADAADLAAAGQARRDAEAALAECAMRLKTDEAAGVAAGPGRALRAAAAAVRAGDGSPGALRRAAAALAAAAEVVAAP